MEADNKPSVSEAGGRRKSFLEKLGLVEPVMEGGSQSDPSNDESAEVPQSPASISALFANEPTKKVDIPAEPTAAATPVNPIEPEESVKPAVFTQPEPSPMFAAGQMSDTPHSKGNDYQSAVASQKNIQMLTVAEIYTLFNLKPSSDRDTVYLIENFLQALPVNLPLEIKKDSLQKLLRASNFDADQLASDGKERIRTLDRYLDSFTQDLEDVISYNESQVAELKEKIRQHTDMIAEKTRMIAEQKSLVRFESHRISALLDSLEKGRS